jgi:hypothetical protein
VKHNALDIGDWKLSNDQVLGDWKLSEIFYEGYTGLKWIQIEMDEIHNSG